LASCWGKEEKVLKLPARLRTLRDITSFVLVRHDQLKRIECLIPGPCSRCDEVPYRFRDVRADTDSYLMAATRFALLALCLALLLCGCGGGEMSLTEYTQRINAAEIRANEQGKELAAEAEDVVDFTPQDLQAILEQARVIRIEVKEATDDIDPPEQVADIHNLVFDWHTEFIAIEEALAARAGTAPHSDDGWTTLSDSAEMAAYRDAIAEGKQVCVDFQSRLDATAERGVFADTPWIPGEMKEVVKRVLGCGWFPENPEDVYRYPPPDSTS
jgi:hypothetical protein